MIVVIVEVLYPVEVSFVVVVPLLYVRVEARGTVEALTVEHEVEVYVVVVEVSVVILVSFLYVASVVLVVVVLVVSPINFL